MAVARDRLAALASRVTGTPLTVLLTALAFVLVNYLAARHYRRLDWTRHRMFTLSARSSEIVHSLRAPTEVYVLLGHDESQYADVTELVQRYAAEGSRLRAHAIDPDRQRDRFLEFTRRLGLRVGRSQTSDTASEAAIVVVRGSRHWEVSRESLVGMGSPGSDEEPPSPAMGAEITVERALSEALVRVDREQSTRVCIASGHGEVPLEGGDDSMSLLATDLRHLNITVDAMPLTGATPVRSDCDALVIAGPRQAWASAEADSVVRYLRAGGNVLLLVDPFFTGRDYAPNGLETVAALGGIELTRTVVIEPDAAHRIPEMPMNAFMATEFGEHPITRPMRGTDARVFVSTARALRRSSASNVIPESLLRTTNGAWGESNLAGSIDGGELRSGPEDTTGPVHLGMAAQVPEVRARTTDSRQAAGRLVVLGESHLVTNESFSVAYQARFANNWLVESALGWLTAREELVEIPARPASAAALHITVESLRYVLVYAIILLPLAGILVGIAVSRARKAD